MKNLKMNNIVALFSLTLLAFSSACNKSENSISDKDKDALLFMLEEEKLARDTYIFLDDLWSLQQFTNIKESEQKHMDAIISVLKKYNIPYSIKEEGVFTYQALQDHYNHFVEDGVLSEAHALQIGATIEDLDILDLINFENAATNVDVVNVFSTLRCGSRNHIRNFSKIIVDNGDSYIPQFISLADYVSITSGNNEKCGK